MRKYTNPCERTAEDWAALATQSARTAQDSWERSDTDGALTQWAGNVMARFYRDVAAVAAAGGRAQIPWLFDAATQAPLDDWRWVQTRYGSSVAIGPRDDTTWFRPSQAFDPDRREAADRAKGYVWGVVDVEVVLYQYGDIALMTGRERKRGAPVTVVSVGGYDDRRAV